MARVKVVNGRLQEDLNGAAFNNSVSRTIFNFGQFRLETNFTTGSVRDYSNVLGGFSKTLNLDKLGVSTGQSEKINNYLNSIVLNYDRSDIRKFVKWGSAREYFRTTIGNILLDYPASIFLTDINSVGGNLTFTNYLYNELTDTTTLRIPSEAIVNNYGLVLDDGNTSIPNNKELRNLNLSFENYVVWLPNDGQNEDHPVIGYTGDTANRAYLSLIVRGNPLDLTGTTPQVGTTKFHVKPQKKFMNEFLFDLTPNEEFFLTNRTPNGYQFTVKEPLISNTGRIIYNDKRFLWGTSDGYNLDFDNPQYNVFIENLLGIGANYDRAKTDLIIREYITDNLIQFDNTDEQKMTKLLRIYGKEFDNIRIFIDSLSQINKVSYDKEDNVPDRLVKNLARSFGWNTFQIVSEESLVESFFSNEIDRSYNNHTPAEIDIELWRRILINSNHFWKNKNTRDGIRSILLLIGIPDPFINISEYVYTVDNKINPDNVELTIEDFDSESLPYDTNGYPLAPVETPEFYFQISGNNDTGQAYLDNFRKAGFFLRKTNDNKKSWVAITGITERSHYSSPNYIEEESRLLINTKEVNITLDTARAIECDVFNYNKEVDFPITSTGVTRPFIYINVAGEYGVSATTFTIPDTPLNDNIQLNFNGQTLTKGAGADYIVSTADSKTVILNTESAITYSNGNKDVITLTYMYDKLGLPQYNTIKYVVTTPNITPDGTILELPSGSSAPLGDIQLTVDGQTLSKSTSLLNGDFIIDPNDNTRVIIQNNTLQNFLATGSGFSPIVRIWYMTEESESNAQKRSEIYRVDSTTTGKLRYNGALDKYVYIMDLVAIDQSAIKVTLNGKTLQNGTDFTLNPVRFDQILFDGDITLGDIIGVYYVIGESGIGLSGSLLPTFNNQNPFENLDQQSFLEYLDNVSRFLINPKNHKTLSSEFGYPTPLKIYDEYLKRSFLNEESVLKSNGYTYSNLYSFISRYNGFFNRFVTQLLSVTAIVTQKGISIRNTEFSRQKYVYKRGVSFDPDIQYLGDDGAEYVKKYEDDNIKFFPAVSGSTNELNIVNNNTFYPINNFGTIDFVLNVTTDTGNTFFGTSGNSTNVGYAIDYEIETTNLFNNFTFTVIDTNLDNVTTGLTGTNSINITRAIIPAGTINGFVIIRVEHIGGLGKFSDIVFKFNNYQNLFGLPEDTSDDDYETRQDANRNFGYDLLSRSSIEILKNLS